MKEVTRVIASECPICSQVVPIAEITATQTSRWRPDLYVTIQGDATDYVAHLWAHQQNMI